VKGKLGIYLRYEAGQSIRDQGIGRHLTFLLGGWRAAGGGRVVFATPGWFVDDLRKLLADSAIDDAAFEIVSTRVPFLMRLRAVFTRARRRRPPRRQRRRLIARALAALSVHLLGQSHPLAFALVGIGYLVGALVLLPLAVLVAALVVAVRAARSLRRLCGRLLRALPQAPKAMLRGLLREVSDEVAGRHARALVRRANRRRDVGLWFVPTIAWTEVAGLEAKVVLSVPDLVYLSFPTSFASPYFEAVDAAARSLLGKAAGIVCFSEHVKQAHVLPSLEGDADRVFVVKHGAIDLGERLDLPATTDASALRVAAREVVRDHQASLPQERRYLRDFDLGSATFVLYSSQVRPHKNFLNLFRAVELVLRERHRSFKLITTGNFGADEELHAFVGSRRLEYDILSLHDVPAKVLAALNALATCSISASLFEGGFPFTFSEAFSVGTPSVLSAIPVVDAEIDDQALRRAMLFDPHDPRDIAARLEGALADPRRLYELERPLYERLRARTWTHVAEDYLDVFHQVAGRGEP
jgi:glycosyltransferase involved in cell wall biosynthesis